MGFKNDFKYEPVEQKQKKTFSKLLTTAFRTENIIGSGISNFAGGGYETDINFNYKEAFEALPDFYKLNEGISKKLAHAENQEHFNHIKQNIDEEIADKEFLAGTGVKGFAANTIAVLADPTSFIPGVTIFKSAKVAKSAGSIAKAGVNAGVSGVVSVSAQEAILQSQQATRTLNETMVNISAGGVFSAVLGSAGHALFAKSPEYSGVKKDLENAMDLDRADEVELQGKSVGAAAVSTKTRKELLKDNSLVNEKLFTASKISRTDPALRLITSQSLQARKAMQNLVEFVPKLKKNIDGEGNPLSAEELILQDKGRLANIFLNNKEQYVKYKQRIPQGQERLSELEFRNEITKRLHRFDPDEDIPNKIPEVEAAVKKVRELYEYVGKEGIDTLGFFGNPGAVEDQLHYYVSRMYDRNKIASNSKKFRGKIAEYLKKEYEISDSKEKARILEALKEDGDIDRYFENLARQVENNILGNSGQALDDGIGFPNPPSFLKSRKILLENSELEDFLELDVNVVLGRYMNYVSPRLRMSQTMGVDFIRGDKKAPAMELIDAEYGELEMKVGNDAKKLNKLRIKKEKDLNDLLAIRDRLLGRHGYASNPDGWLYRGQKQLKQFNVATMLGDVVASSTADIGKLVLANGFSKMFSLGLKPLAKSLTSKTYRNYLKNNMSEARDMGVALELSNNHLINARAGLSEDYAKTTKFERTANMVAQKAITLTGMRHWNAGLKDASGRIVNHKIYKALYNVYNGKGSKKEISNLAKSGISSDLIPSIMEQLKKHGEFINVKGDDVINTPLKDNIKPNNNGLLFANFDKWDLDSQYLTEIYKNAVRKEVDAVIVTPGAATTPLWMSQHGLTLFGQFQSFAFASMQKTLIPAIQDFDFNTFQGLATMVGIGTLISMYKRSVSGQEMPDNNLELVREGVSRSGVLSWLLDYNDRLEKLSKGNIGLSRVVEGVTGVDTSPEAYYNRSYSSAALGPSASTIDNLGKITSSILSGDIDKRTIRAARRLIPLQNMIGIRQTFDKLEKEFNSQFNIPSK